MGTCILTSRILSLRISVCISLIALLRFVDRFATLACFACLEFVWIVLYCCVSLLEVYRYENFIALQILAEETTIYPNSRFSLSSFQTNISVGSGMRFHNYHIQQSQA